MKQNIKTAALTIITSILILLSQLSYAAVMATVSDNQVAKGEVFTLKIVSNNRSDSDDINFSVLENDFYIGRPSFSSSLNSINGTRSIRSEWTLSLAAVKTGNLTIPSFTVRGEKTIPIKVVSSLDPSTPKSDDLVTYQTQLSKNEIYPGEIAQLDTKLIIKTDARRIQNPKITPASASNGLNIDPIGEAKQYQSVIDGIEATIVEQSYHVMASQAGKFTINGPKISATILDGNNRQGTTRLIPINSESELFPILVLKKPENVKGAWLPSPNLTLSQAWSDDSGQNIASTKEKPVFAGSPITREITLNVEGIDQSQMPNITVHYPKEVRYYDEPPKIVQEGNHVTMTLKHVLIPKTVGEVTLPSITLNWWNTVNKKPQTEQLSGLTLMVKKSETPSITLAPHNNSPAQPIPSKPNTIIVTQTGVWPYLTGIFAFLWLITVGLLLRNRKTVSHSKKKIEKESNNFNTLIQSIRNRDGLSTQANLTRWYDENPQLDPTMKAELSAKIESMISALYSEKPKDWNEEKLIEALKKANKTKPKAQKKENGLATL